MPNFNCQYLLSPGDIVQWVRDTDLVAGRTRGDIGTVIEVRMHPYNACSCLKYGCEQCQHARNHYDVMVMCKNMMTWYEAYSWDIVCPATPAGVEIEEIYDYNKPNIN